MKKTLTFLFLLVLGVAAVVNATTPSGWTEAKSGPYLSLGGGGEFHGPTLVGKGQNPGSSFRFSQPCTLSGTALPYNLVELSGITYSTMSVWRSSTATQPVTKTVGVVLLPPSVTSATTGSVVQVSTAGSLVPVKVVQPLTVNLGDLLVSSTTAGELTRTTNTSLTDTAQVVNFQALETKTTSSGDQFIYARQLR